MAPVLRKRKAPQPPPEPPAKKSNVAKTATKAKAPVAKKAAKPAAKANGSAAVASGAPKPAVGDLITLDGFGGEVETNDGDKTTLKALVDKSKAGVVLFTYPKASTPGCKILDLPLSPLSRPI
jgi:peroxiredoxin Q/BCP